MHTLTQTMTLGWEAGGGGGVRTCSLAKDNGGQCVGGHVNAQTAYEH